MGFSFSTCHEGEQQESIPRRTDSIFRDMSNENKMKQRFGFEEDYKIGPYFSQTQENKSKIIRWKKMADKSNKKRSAISIKNNNSNKFIVNKIETMLFEISETNQESFLKNILDGPPMTLRWGSWKTMLIQNIDFESGLYERLIEKLEENPDYEQIQKDIIRTFPTQYYFSHSGIKGKSLGHQQLHRVLGAISKYFPGAYCQSMNFILAFLIMVSGGNEIDVFWSFVSLVKNKKFLIIGLYEPGLPLLRFLESVTMKVMEKEIPHIVDKFQELCVPSGFWLLKWFMTMFTYAFPINICLRIWDFILCEGIFGLVYIVIPILKSFENLIMEFDDLEDLEQFQELTRQDDKLENKDSEFYMDMKKIIGQAQKLRFSQTAVVKLANEFMEANSDNEYVKLYTIFDDQEEFGKLVKKFMEPKIYTHPSQSQQSSQKQSLVQSNKNDPNQEKEEELIQQQLIEEVSIQEIQNSNYQQDQEQYEVIQKSKEEDEEQEVINM